MGRLTLLCICLISLVGCTAKMGILRDSQGRVIEVTGKKSFTSEVIEADGSAVKMDSRIKSPLEGLLTINPLSAFKKE